MTERNCKNCACYAEIILSPIAPPQAQCRRNGPVPAQIRIERPRMKKVELTGKMEVMMGKDGKPITETSVENVFLYAPTASDKVCFDGWRPMGTEPGENAQTMYIKDALKTAMNVVHGKFSDNVPREPMERDEPEFQRNSIEEPGNLPHG
jgi:hypothetical protein